MRSRLCVAVVLWMALPAAAGETPDALVRGLGSPSPEVRAQAAARLREAGDDAVPALVSGLASADTVVAMGCADLVAEKGAREARAGLRAILERKDAPALLVRAACRALGRCGDYRDLELLGRLAPKVGEAALALADLGEPDAREILRAIAPAETTPLEVAFALARLGDLSAVPRLIAALDGEADEALAAGLYLRRIAGREVGEKPADWRTWLRREKLAKRLGAADWKESEKALAEVLGDDGRLDEGMTADLLALATDETYPRDARTKAILALGLGGDVSLSGTLVGLLKKDADPNVRLYAAEALGRLGDPAVAAELAYYLIFDEEPFRKLSEKMLRVDYVTIDSEICEALVRLGVTGGLDFMIRQLGQQHRIRVYHEAVRTLRSVTGQNMDFRPDGNTRQRALAARRWRLWFDEHREEIRPDGPARAGSPRLTKRIEEFVDTLGGYKYLYMSRAKESLILLGDIAMKELLRGLRRPEMHIRAHCLEVLGQIHAKSARGAIVPLLSDPREEVRIEAAAALADMGPGEAADGVEKALADPVASVRIEAARALARAEPERARKALGAALEKKENDLPAFRREAWFALAAHGDAAALDRLLGLLDLSGEGVSFLRSVEDRVDRLTGRVPGPTEEKRKAFLEWWKVSRASYRPEYPYGPNGNEVTPR